MDGGKSRRHREERAEKRKTIISLSRRSSNKSHDIEYSDDLGSARQAALEGDQSPPNSPRLACPAIEAGERYAERLRACHGGAGDGRGERIATSGSRRRRAPAPLEGIPLGIKDLFATKGVRTTACSHILDSFEPPYESTVTANLWATARSCSASSTWTSSPWARPTRRAPYGQCHQSRGAQGLKTRQAGARADRPADRRRPVAAGLCLGATATDTGGSIRQPAAFTGTVGIKPTYGRCSRWGIVAFASSLDQAGPIAPHCPRRRASCSSSMASHDPKDTTSRRSCRFPIMRRPSAAR